MFIYLRQHRGEKNVVYVVRRYPVLPVCLHVLGLLASKLISGSENRVTKTSAGDGATAVQVVHVQETFGGTVVEITRTRQHTSPPDCYNCCSQHKDTKDAKCPDAQCATF